MHVRYLFTTALAFGALFSVTPADAQAPGPGSKDDWRFTVGAAAAYGPDYEGSDDYAVSPLPVIGVSWRDTVSVGSADGAPGLTVKFLKVQGPTPKDRFVLSSTLGYFGGRDQDDNDALKGLGNIDGGVVARLAARYTLRDFGADLALARDLSGDREGMTIKAGVNYTFALGSPRTALTVGTSTTWADDNYMESGFGISAAQAASSSIGYAAYEAGSGIKDVGVDVAVRHFWTKNWGVMGSLGYTHLLGDAADSPLVDGQGSAGQVSLMVGTVYTW